MKYLTDVILVLLKYAEDESRDGWFHGITRMEKVIFLLQKERGLDRWITHDKPDFSAYKLGPYSREIYTAAEFLNTYNLIEDATFMGNSRLDTVEEGIALESEYIGYSERRFRLTELGRKAATTLVERSDHQFVASIREYYREFNSMPLTSLLRYVYQRYPKYTVRSTIKDSIMPKDIAYEANGQRHRIYPNSFPGRYHCVNTRGHWLWCQVQNCSGGS